MGVMATSENTLTDAQHRVTDRLATASDFAYALMQALAELQHELVAHLEPLDADSPIGKAYEETILGSGAAMRAHRSVAEVAAALERAKWFDFVEADQPALTVVGAS